MKRTCFFILAAFLAAAAAAPQNTGQMMKQPAAAMGMSAMCADTTDLSSVLHGFGCPWCFLGSSDSLGLTLKDAQLLEVLGSECEKKAEQYQTKADSLRSELTRILGMESVKWEKAKQIISEFYGLKRTALIDQLECLRAAQNALSPEMLQKAKSLDMEAMHRNMTGKSAADSSSAAP